MFLIEDEVLVG